MEDRHRKIVTVMLILAWVSMGLYMEIGGPTMLDLRIHFNSNSEEIARSVSAQGIGIFLGALIGGLFVDVLNTWKILLVTGAQLLATFTIVSMPYVGSLSVLWFMFFLLGTAAGIVNVSGQRIILEMWKEKAPSPMHATHMGFGIGAVAAPLIANPFLAVLDFSQANTTTEGNASSPNSESYVIVEETRVQYAYVTIGLVSLMLSSPFLIYPFIKCCFIKDRDQYVSFDCETSPKVSKLKKLIDAINPATYAGGKRTEMAWHKQKQYDPTDAFIQNERHQKVLDLKLQKIDKLWYNQLRILSRDRLQITSEVMRLEDEKSQLEYFDENMEVHKLKEYTDGCMMHMKQLKRELTQDNFNFENTGAIHMKRILQTKNLPKLGDGSLVTQSRKHNKKSKKPEKSKLRKRRKSNLLKSKIFSISDSNLDKVSKYKQEINESDAADSKHEIETKLKVQETEKTNFPNISSRLKVSRTNEQHRYLKDKMATALVLPTLSEVVPRQRKLSI